MTVELVSGITIRGVLPHLPELARSGLIPTELRAAALHFGDPRWLTGGDDVTEAEARQRTLERTTVLRLLVARFPRDVQVDEGPPAVWEPLGRSIEERLAAVGSPGIPGTMDPLDVDLLEDLVLRIRSPLQVTAEARRIRGLPILIEDAIAAMAREREAAATVAGQMPFRGEPGSPADGPDSTALGHSVSSSRVPRAGRSRAGVRGRRGAHVA